MKLKLIQIQKYKYEYKNTEMSNMLYFTWEIIHCALIQVPCSHFLSAWFIAADRLLIIEEHFYLMLVFHFGMKNKENMLLDRVCVFI